MIELDHARDRKRFKENMACAAITEQLMKDQRRKLGLPENPKPLKIGKVTQLLQRSAPYPEGSDGR